MMKTIDIHFNNNKPLRIKLHLDILRDLVNKLQSSGFGMTSSYEDYQVVINWKNVNYIEIHD